MFGLGIIVALIAGQTTATASAASAATTATARTTTVTATVAHRFHPDDPRADHQGTPPLPPPPSSADQGSLAPGEPRRTPNYEGREEPPATAGEVMIWIPRVVFFPARVVLEYGVRWPLVKLLTLNDEYKLAQRALSIFTFREGHSGIFPTALIDFGLSPSVGFYTFHDQLFHPAHSLSAQGGFWTEDWLHLSLADRWSIFGGEGELVFRGELGQRPDEPYFGTGYAARQEDRQDLRFRRVDAEIELASYVGGLNRVRFRLRFRDAELLARRGPALPGPQRDNYDLLGGELSLALDSRSPEKERTSGTGLRAEATVGYFADPGPRDTSFFRFGGSAGGFFDPAGTNHVLALVVYADLIARTNGDALPLTELISVENLRGFIPGRFRGESAVGATLSYRYPIWVLLDAELYLGVGNAFGPGLVDFRFDRLVLNGGLALRLGVSRDTSIDLLVGFGTNRLGAPALEVDSFRFSFGAKHGF